MGILFVGDNGTAFNMTVSDEKGIVDLTAAQLITAKFVRGDGTSFDKTLTITDAINGGCTTTVLSADLIVPGDYTFQVTVKFNDGKEFAGLPRKFTVKARK